VSSRLRTRFVGLATATWSEDVRGVTDRLCSLRDATDGCAPEGQHERARMRAVVTGGAGFIGHHLVDGLVSSGHDVSVIDDFSSGRYSRLAKFGDAVTLTEATILDADALDVAVAGADVIFHEAAIASVARSLHEPRLTNDVNENGTIEVMRAASRNGVRRVVFAGSSAVYGIPEDLPCRESHRPAPRSPYGVSKLAAELYVHALGESLGIQTVVLRYFNVYGPGQDPASEYAAVIPRFVTAVLDGERPTIYGTGDISRDFVYIDDVVEANMLASQAAVPANLTCNIATGYPTTLDQLLRTVVLSAGIEVDPVFGPPRPADIPHSYADIGVAGRALGYAPRTSLADGIARTIDWYRRASMGPTVTASGPIP
jgi:UDP-N-acetylglucosamine/UDP-N-acetyl-alpha-D-glucosaminouronate 4-epimerase